MPNKYREVAAIKGKGLINGNKNHGWGIDDSLQCIMAIIIDETGAPEIAENEEFVSAIRELVNPSQFRQKLETAKILNKTEKKEQKTSKITEGWE